MPAGRPPKPTKIKEIEGNRGRRPIPKTVESHGRPLMPDHLDEEQQMIWRQIVKALPPGVLTFADTQAVERMAVAWARFRDCQRKISQMTMFSRGSGGQLVVSPLVKIQNLAVKEMHQAGEALGLSPVARARISAPEAADDDPLTLLLEGQVYTPAPATPRLGKRSHADN